MARFTGDDLATIRGERLVFKGISFVVERGQALLLTGPNGSGKSSLMRLLAGLARPDAGRIAWDGADIFRDREGHGDRLVWVGHQDGIRPGLTPLETLGYWAAIGGMADRDGSRRAMALAAFGLERLARVPARNLSSGQRRRLALCRVLLRPAALWLLDEPSVGLDAAGQAALATAIAGHRAAGGMLVLTTHQPLDLPEARLLELPGGGG